METASSASTRSSWGRTTHWRGACRRRQPFSLKSFLKTRTNCRSVSLWASPLMGGRPLRLRSQRRVMEVIMAKQMSPRRRRRRNSETPKPLRWLVFTAAVLGLWSAGRWAIPPIAEAIAPDDMASRPARALSSAEVEASVRTQVRTMRSLREAYLERKRARRNGPAAAAARAAREDREVPRGPRKIDAAGRARIEDAYRQSGLQHPEVSR